MAGARCTGARIIAVNGTRAQLRRKRRMTVPGAMPGAVPGLAGLPEMPDPAALDSGVEP
jgi:hypothetical protein